MMIFHSYVSLPKGSTIRGSWTWTPPFSLTRPAVAGAEKLEIARVEKTCWATAEPTWGHVQWHDLSDCVILLFSDWDLWYSRRFNLFWTGKTAVSMGFGVEVVQNRINSLKLNGLKSWKIMEEFHWKFFWEMTYVMNPSLKSPVSLYSYFIGLYLW